MKVQNLKKKQTNNKNNNQKTPQKKNKERISIRNKFDTYIIEIPLLNTEYR